MTNKSNGLKAANNLREFLEEEGWYPEEIDESTFHCRFKGHFAEFSVYARIRPELELLLCYSSSPLDDLSREQAVVGAELLTRANYGMRVGNFEFDYDDGEVRFKSSLDFQGVVLEPKLIKNTLYPCAYTMDRYLPALYAVIYDHKSALDALAMIEK